MSVTSKIAILGAGSWGTTLAWLAAESGRSVTLWSSRTEKAELLNNERQLNSPLKIKIPQSVVITADLNEALSEQDTVLICCNSQSMRNLCQNIAHCLNKVKGNRNIVFVSAVKGLELKSLKRMSQVISEIIPSFPVCALSGPNLAVEILNNLPTASVVACQSSEIASMVQKQLNTQNFRVYTNVDVIGVELGGTLKNVIAIAAGISDGLSLGANAKAALLTRGLAEMTRLAVASGAQKSTLAGLSGIGDLFATCISPLSRNYRLGIALAHGMGLAAAEESIATTAEGIPTAEAVCELSQKLQVNMPIAEQVEATLKGKTTPKDAILSLMTRPLASE